MDRLDLLRQRAPVPAGEVDEDVYGDDAEEPEDEEDDALTQSQLITSALPESELFELDKYPELALEVTNGNIAGLVVDSAVGDSIVANSNGALAVSNFAFTAEEASFGKSVVIAKGNEDLVAAVNAVIAEVLADGSYQAAYDEAVALAAKMGV